VIVWDYTGSVTWDSPRGIHHGGNTSASQQALRDNAGPVREGQVSLQKLHVK